MTDRELWLSVLLEEKQRRSWSGTISLNIKDGTIIAYEVTEKVRISRETHVSRDPGKVDARDGPRRRS